MPATVTPCWCRRWGVDRGGCCGLQVQTMLAAANADMAPPSHDVGAFKLLDGGLRDGGWTGEGRPKSGHALAITQNATHYDVHLSPVFVAAALDFLVQPFPSCAT